MHEVQVFLQAIKKGENPDLEILPLFFRISPDYLKDPENERRWLRIWQEWATKDSRVDISVWRNVPRILKSYNGIVFQQGMGEVEYRRMIVKSICDIVPPSITADLSYVQGGERICQQMINIFNQLPCRETRLASDTQILAVYASSGMGKTTLCKIMRNHFQRICRACHIQVGANGLDLLSSQKIVLKQLTGASESLLQNVTDIDEAQDLLIRRINKQRVFLAIDDACTAESPLQMSRMFLRLPFTKESLVLVTACTHEDLLEVIGYDISEKCFHIPNLTEGEAIQILLNRAIPNCNISSLQESHQQIIRQRTSLCQIMCTIHNNSRDCGSALNEYYYHPSTLIEVGAQLGGNLANWNTNFSDRF